VKITKTNDMGSHFLKVLVSGGAGAGKTRLCATTGDPDATVIISAEGGLLSLRDHGITAIEVKTLADGSMVFSPSMPGKTLTQGIAYFFDEVFALRVHTDDEGNIQRWLQTSANGSYTAKDRSGALDLFEPCDLSHIANKILGGS
jgi:hypothetical protein